MGEWENDVVEADVSTQSEGVSSEPDVGELSDMEEEVLDMDMMGVENAVLNEDGNFDSPMSPISRAATRNPLPWDRSPEAVGLGENVTKDVPQSDELTDLEPGNAASETLLDEGNPDRGDERIREASIHKDLEPTSVNQPASELTRDEAEDRSRAPNIEQDIPATSTEHGPACSAAPPHQEVAVLHASTSASAPVPVPVPASASVPVLAPASASVPVLAPASAPIPASAVHHTNCAAEFEAEMGIRDAEIDPVQQVAQPRPHKRKLEFVDFTKYQTEPRRRKLWQEIKVVRTKEEWKLLQERFKENNRVQWKNPEFGKAVGTLIRMCEINSVRSFEAYASLIEQILEHMRNQLSSDPDFLKRRAEQKPEVVSMVEEMVRMCFPLIVESDGYFIDCALDLMENLDRNGLLSEKLIQELAQLRKGDQLFLSHKEVNFANRYYSYDVQTFAKRFESQVDSLIYHPEFCRARGLCYDEDMFFGFDSEIESSFLHAVTERFAKAPTQFREKMFKYLVNAFDNYEDVVYCTLLTIVLCDLDPKPVEECCLTSCQRVSMYLSAGFHCVTKPSLEELGRFREDVKRGIVGPDPLSLEGECTLMVLSSIQGISFLSKWFIQHIQHHASFGSSDKKELEVFKSSDAYLGLLTMNLLSFYAYDILHGDARDVGIEEYITQKKAKHEANVDLMIEIITWNEGYKSSFQGTKSTVFSDRFAEEMRAASGEDLFFRRFIVSYADMRLLEGEYEQFIDLQPAMDEIHLQFGETKMDNNNSRGQWRDASLNKFFITYSLYDPDTFKSVQSRMQESRISGLK